MKQEIREKMERELADWKQRMEVLRMKAKLGSMELRDKEREVINAFEPAYEKAMVRLKEAGEAAEFEAKAARTGIEAGWRELRRVWEEARKGGQAAS
ncbi:MAG TPA: hypothetical protein VMT18_10530 [Planctomycetota bacterium]|nr:hypothetical protein [Planctomycetota bacterium]